MTAHNPDDDLAEKEFLLINEIAREPTRTQRDISERLGLSLGMTNLLIQRLARKGLIKISQLDWKRTQYLLTLKGALEKTRKTYDYTLYTLRIFRQIRENITAVLLRELEAGRREFTVVAEDEILDLLRKTIGELGLPQVQVAYLRSFTEVPEGADLVLTATREAPRAGPPERRYLSIVDFVDIDFRMA